MKTQESEEFKVFWEDVWRKHARHTDGRGLARDTFSKHVKCGADPQDIIDGAKWFFLSMKDRDRDFVPLSSTWINRRSYEDMALQYRAYEARKQERQRAPEPQGNVVSISPERRQEMGRALQKVAENMRVKEV